MPILSMFYGLTIRMYMEPNEKHHLPHIHVKYQGNEYIYDLEGNALEKTDLPSNKRKLLDAWMEIHRDELYQNWDLLEDGEAFFKIEPLK